MRTITIKQEPINAALCASNTKQIAVINLKSGQLLCPIRATSFHNQMHRSKIQSPSSQQRWFPSFEAAIIHSILNLNGAIRKDFDFRSIG